MRTIVYPSPWLLVVTLGLALRVLAQQTEDTTSSGLTVLTTSGLVKGFVDKNTTSIPLKKWLGIRFAQDTSGPNRWVPPKKISPARPSEVFDATKYGPACLQGRENGGNGTEVQSEDCLRINVIAPANAGRNAKLPVYLYSHGGGFDSGASSDPKIDGSYLAAKGIVFASYNYRLSLFGFPHSAELAAQGKTQNFGLLDTRAAVEWLRDNADRFGGDPRKITLGGESVGAEMTNFYLSAYAHDPIIRGAVMQSGDTAQPMWPINQQLSIVAANMSCPNPTPSRSGRGQSQLDCLRAKSGPELRKALLDTKTQFQPVTDNITVWKDYVAQTKAGHTVKVPLLIGTNKDEGSLIVEGEPTAYLSDITAYSKSNNLNFPFAPLSELEEYYPVPSPSFPSPYNATSAMWGDAHMLCLAHNLATHRTTHLNLPVWRYRFDHVADNLNSRGSRIGAFHGSDIRFVMGTWRTIVMSPPYVEATKEQRELSDLMVEAWVGFIKDPWKGPGIPGWRRYDPGDPSTLAIFRNLTTGVEVGNHREVDRACAVWNKVLPVFPQVFPDCGSWTC
ncbi:hypothetical protein AX16_002874 [Volvariella volvacea WC 439]|nr:hypothetical protein AX16_002874 [Volvariella volvacea WC 439]